MKEKNLGIDLDEKFSALVRTTPDTIIIIDETNKVIFCNDNIIQTFGYKPEEFINLDMSVIVPHRYREAHKAGMKRFMDTGLPRLIGKTIEITGLKKDGSEFPIELSLSFWKEKNKFFFSSIIRDISDRKKIQQELELLLSISEAISEARDFETAITTTLEKVCEHTGWEYGESWLPTDGNKNIYFSSWFSKKQEYREFAEASQGIILESGQSMGGRVFEDNIEWIPDISVYTKQDFSRIDLVKKFGIRAGLGVPITVNNEVLAALLFFRDTPLNEDSGIIKLIISVTKQVGSVLQRKKAEEALKTLNIELEAHVKRRTREVMETLEQFKFLADAIPQIVWTAQRDGQIDYFNSHWYKYTGLSFKDSYNAWKEVIHLKDVDKTLKAWQNSINTGKPFQAEFRLRRSSDDTFRWHLCRALPMRTDQEKIVKWFGTFTDIHDQKMTEESLQSKNKELHTINSDLDNFVYTASHDLKSPIANLEGLLYSLQNETGSNVSQEIHNLIAMMFSSVKKFKNTIQELADISRIQKNIEEDIDAVKISELVDEFRITHKEIIDKSKAKIGLDLKVQAIRFSKRNIRSIIDNLLSNAIKYQSLDKSPEILIGSRKEKGYVLLYVKDNGLGINIEQKDKMFSMFKRLHDHVEGTGVGLYIVKRIVENAGGFIEVESEVGTGSVFKIYFRN